MDIKKFFKTQLAHLAKAKIDKELDRKFGQYVDNDVIDTSLLDNFMETEEGRLTKNTKPAYTSKGVMGGIGALVIMVAGMFGYVISEEDIQALILIYSNLVAAVSVVIGIYGRIVATSKIVDE